MWMDTCNVTSYKCFSQHKIDMENVIKCCRLKNLQIDSFISFSFGFHEELKDLQSINFIRQKEKQRHLKRKKKTEAG